MKLSRVEFLEKQVEILQKEKNAALEALELTRSLGNFSTSLTHLEDSLPVLKEICGRARSMIRFQATSLFIVDEASHDFRLACCDSPGHRDMLERQVGVLIGDQSFAYALQAEAATFFLAEDGLTWLMLHPVATSSRVRGMFVGLLEQDRHDILDTTLLLFSVVMLAAAHALEGFELYRLFRRHRQELESTVIERTHALREANEQLTAIQDAIPVGILISNASSHRIVSVNTAALSMLAASAETVVGQDVRQFFGSFGESGQGLQYSQQEMLLHAASGERIPVLCREQICHLRQQPHTIHCFLDISEQKKFTQLKEDVERITRHDLKTPLNGIIGVPELLLETDLTEEQHELVSYIRDAGLKMLRMINTSLDMYKMEIGAYVYQPLPVNILHVLQMSLRDMVGITVSKNLRFDLLLDGRAVGSTEELIVPGEELLAYSMFANLLVNAAEAAPSGSRIAIAVSSGPCIRVAIRNCGGVPEDLRPRFFDKYATQGKSHGSGLGTYSAQLIAQTMAGHIELDTSVDDETTVAVVLPAS